MTLTVHSCVVAAVCFSVAMVIIFGASVVVFAQMVPGIIRYANFFSHIYRDDSDITENYTVNYALNLLLTDAPVAICRRTWVWTG
jgi:hypothetical protein